MTEDPLEAIDLVVFDKDGTLIDFHAMWGGWARELGRRLEAATRRPVSADVFAVLGFDPSTGRVAPSGPLATGTMAGIHELIGTILRRWCPSPAAARAATDAAWLVPDPVALAVPLGDLAALFGDLAADGRRIAVVTTDDRDPTDRTLRGLGVRERVGALVCGDDGFPTKPEPDAVLAVCEALGVDPARTAVVGDTPADLAMARAAAVGRVIGVLSGLGTVEDLEASADFVFPSVDALRTPA